MTDAAVDADDLAHGLACVRAFGWNATAFQGLEPGFALQRVAGGCVAYVDTGGAWVAAGAPLVAEQDLEGAACAFAARAEAAGRRAVFCGVERRFLLRAPSFAASYAGAQAVWDPRAWDGTLAGSRSLRAQLRRARGKGVTVRDAALDAGSPDRGALDALRARRVARRPLPPLGFLLTVDPGRLSQERRAFVAERDGERVGFALAAPVPGRGPGGGWLVEDLVLHERAPNGTSDALVDAAFRAFADEGARYATLGIAPLAPTPGRPELVPPGVVTLAARALARFYDVEGQRRFRARLAPSRWDPVWLATTPRVPAWRAALDVASAFTGGSLLAFAVRAAARGLGGRVTARPRLPG